MGRRSSAIQRRRLERDQQLRWQSHLARTAQERGCLFCRNSDGSFRSQEHVFPESLGNKTLVLPVGVVCDRCNNGPLAQVDKALCDFMPIAMRRTTLGIQSKSGVVPQFRYFQGAVRHVAAADGGDPTLMFDA